METKTRQQNVAFTEYYVQYFQVIRTYIAFRIPHPYEAEDLTQEVFIRLLECGQLINATTIRSFLFVIARNLVRDVLRRCYCHKNVIKEWEKNVVVSTNTTEQDVVANDLARIFQIEISKLTPKRRMVYELMDHEGKDINEVASQMSLSVRTVETHLYHARKSIRLHLNQILNAV